MDELDQIVSEIVAGNCIPFLGAGTSVLAGCADWDSIPTKLKSLEVLKHFLDSASAIPSGASRQEIIGILREELVRLGEEDRYRDIFRETITFDVAKITGNYTKLIDAVSKITSLSHILFTTNVDNCLDYTTPFAPKTGNYSIIDSVEKFTIEGLLKGGIFHLHGHSTDWKNIVFTGKAYVDLYSDRGYINFLSHAFRTYTFLFIGYSFSDEQLMNIVEKMRGRRHYALVRKKESLTPEMKTSFREKYNMILIDYPEHALLPDIFGKWINKKFPSTTSVEPKKEDVQNA